MPVFNTYYKHIDTKNYNMMINTISSLMVKYSAGYYCYFYDNRFDINDFNDNDHLNEKGAIKFSLIIKEEIIDKLI